MAKSYWFKDLPLPVTNGQKGNFSNNKQDTFNPKNDFLGVRLQQGVPLLDRDWNELEDIRRYQEVMLRKHYLGNGTPDDGFRISALDPPGNDFKISKGRILVDGFEAVNEPEGADFILYSSQDEAPPLTSFKPPIVFIRSRVDTVYLDVWIGEVTSADLPRLKNPDDVAMETCIRHRLRWFVRVDEGSKGHIPDEGHHFYDLAKITRLAGSGSISAANINDLRSCWQSLCDAQSRLRRAINSLATGNMPSDNATELATFPYPGYGAGVAKDNQGNIIVFWLQENNIWAKRYSINSGSWSAGMQITSGNAAKGYLKSLNDSRGDIWVFWRQEISSAESNIWAKRYDTSTGIWTGDVQLTTGASNKSLMNAFEDSQGSLWIFWGQIEANIYNYRSKKYIGGSWGSDFILTSGTNGKSYGNSFEEKNGILWFFWTQMDSANVNNIFYKKFTSQGWTADAQLTSGTLAKYHMNSFMDARGDIWLFWQQVDSANNYWAKRFTANAWSLDMQLTTETTIKSTYSPLAGKKYGVWFLYIFVDNNNVYTIRGKRFNFDSNQWDEVTVTGGGAGNKRITYAFTFPDGNLGLLWVVPDVGDTINFNMFFNGDDYFSPSSQVISGINVFIIKMLEKSNGELWLLMISPPAYNLRCIRFADGDWQGESRLISGDGGNRKTPIDVFEDAAGDVWAFWNTYSSSWGGPRRLMYKKIYGSI
jgi:hypothetical protein